MSAAAYDVTVLTADAHLAPPAADDWYNAQIHHEEQLLVDGLRNRGLQVVRRSWSDPGFDWSCTRCAILRSTWDYFRRLPEFREWLRRARSATRLVNDAVLLEWNLDKHYLADLAEAGVDVVPTQYIARGQPDSLAAIMGRNGWDEVVFKPVVSGAARRTYRVHASACSDAEARFADCVADEEMLVQPFQRGVLASGEISLVVIGGELTHAVRKLPKGGDFRVQDDHGGTVHPHAASREEVAFAEASVSHCPVPPVYARVDAVRDAAGRLRIMELELIEPELFFRFHPPAAQRLADRVAALLE
jgi:hypothetical protein